MEQRAKHHPIVNLKDIAIDYRLAGPTDSLSESEFLTLRSEHSFTGLRDRKEFAERERLVEIAGERFDLGRAVPVDMFFWRSGPPDRPYLTRSGGVPHRERGEPWPTTDDGRPMTFVAQFCFLDSTDIIPHPVPAEVMLVFMIDTYPSEVYIEWSPLALKEPMTAADRLPSAFAVPEQAGEIYRRFEYPESRRLPEDLELDDWFFPTMPTQHTKIGRAAFFPGIVGEDNGFAEDLLCVLDNFGSDISFGDDGCTYFFLFDNGKMSWESECY